PGFARIINNTVDVGAFESRGFTILTTSGSSQSTPINIFFAVPVVAAVRSPFGEPLSGVVVTFSAPASGASGAFPGNVTSVSVTTNAAGFATAPTFTANSVVGGPYNVIASIGATLPSVS